MKRKILIVDDEQSIADLVEVYLSNEGMEVLKCYNGQDALDCIKKEDLSLAVLDVMLPDIDGYKLCQEIRKEHFYPVIMLTAKTPAPASAITFLVLIISFSSSKGLCFCFSFSVQ